MSSRAAAPTIPRPARIEAWLCALVLVGAIVLAFRGALPGPFVLDDTPAIVENPTIRSFRTALQPPADRGLPVTGRPLVNASLALNYALGGLETRGYHAFNIGLHAATALVLFGLVRRTLPRSGLSFASGRSVTLLAGGIALVWSLHPLQTAAVSYISQRAEMLVALFYLGTLYAIVRSADAGTPAAAWLWRGAALLACVGGMATKEVMVSAPLIAVLYHVTFVSGSWRETWRRERPLIGGMVASWALLLWLVLGTGGRAGTAGFGMGISPWDYALAQCLSIPHYLRVALWPTGLVFDNGGTVLVEEVTRAVPGALLLLALFATTVWMLWRRPAIGFCGLAFFAILAPSSSFVPVADTMFQHRIYLPLAFLVALFATALHRARPRLAPLVLAGLAVPLGVLADRRNDVYRDELSLWEDTVAKRPQNVRGLYTLGSLYAERGDVPAALAAYERALALEPNSVATHNNLANLLTRSGRAADAVPHYEFALARLRSPETHTNFGNALLQLGRRQAAQEQFEAALALRPTFSEAHNNLGNLRAERGDFAAAERHYRAALDARPDLADARGNLANVLAQTGRLEEAVQHYAAALRLRPDSVNFRMNFGRALMELRRWSDAVEHYEAALRLAPDEPQIKAALRQAQSMRDIFERR